jgi:hypothetical protein
MYETRKAPLKNDSNPMEIKALCADETGDSYKTKKTPGERRKTGGY